MATPYSFPLGQLSVSKAYGCAGLGGWKKQMPRCNGGDTGCNITRRESGPTSNWSDNVREFGELTDEGTQMTAIFTAGAPSHTTFENLPWQEIKAQVHRLQMRIAKATREGRKGKVRSLQRLLTHSFYAKCLAVKRVVQNKGANTSGVDKVLWRSSRQRMLAIQDLRRRGYNPLPLRRLYIPKKSGAKEKRPLSIPSMKDRAMQALWQLALIPIAEEWADPNSYGFRPKRSVADAIEQCFIVLSRRKSARWIFEGDIRACFDRLSHTWLEEHIPMDKTILRKFLKAGFMEEGVVYPSPSGAPQGGVTSPTLLVMALSGLEPLLKKHWPHHKVNVVIYADGTPVQA